MRPYCMGISLFAYRLGFLCMCAQRKIRKMNRGQRQPLRNQYPYGRVGTEKALIINLTQERLFKYLAGLAFHLDILTAGGVGGLQACATDGFI